MFDFKEKTVQELKDLLRHNKQTTSGNKSELIDRVVDCVMYGCLTSCPTCSNTVVRVKYKIPYGHDGQGYFTCPVSKNYNVFFGFLTVFLGLL